MPEVHTGTLETWCNLVCNFESVDLERGKESECVADFDAHSLGVECWSEWCTRAIHAWKTVLPDQAWTKAVGERPDGLQLEWYGSDSFSGSDGSDGFDGVDGFDGFDGHDGFDGYDGFDASRGSDGSDGFDGCDGVVLPSDAGIKVAQVKGLQGDRKTPGDELANDDGTKSFRWVQKSQTGGQNCWNSS